jgi:hypothetical protein
MMENITTLLIITVGIYGIMLFIAKDTAIPEQFRSNSTVQMIYNNSAIAGSICIALSYYFYTTLPKDNYAPMDSSVMTTETPEIPLPSYDEATSNEL